MNEILNIWRKLLNESSWSGNGPVAEPIEEDKILPKGELSKEECAKQNYEDHRCYKYTPNTDSQNEEGCAAAAPFPKKGKDKLLKIKFHTS